MSTSIEPHELVLKASIAESITNDINNIDRRIESLRQQRELLMSAKSDITAIGAAAYMAMDSGTEAELRAASARGREIMRRLRNVEYRDCTSELTRWHTDQWVNLRRFA